MDLAILLPLAIFVALASALYVTLQRAGQVLAEGREQEQFRKRVADLSRRIDTSLGGVAELIDAVRRGHVEPASIDENVRAARDAVERYTGEVNELAPPADGASLRDAIAAELERAGRALDMVAHGCEILASASARFRNTEAQTAIKRGYVNVLHARQAVRRHARELGPALVSPRTWLPRRG